MPFSCLQKPTQVTVVTNLHPSSDLKIKKLYNPGRCPNHYGKRRNVSGNNGTCSYNTPPPDHNIARNRYIDSEPAVFLHHHSTGRCALIHIRPHDVAINVVCIRYKNPGSKKAVITDLKKAACRNHRTAPDKHTTTNLYTLLIVPLTDIKPCIITDAGACADINVSHSQYLHIIPETNTGIENFKLRTQHSLRFLKA